MRTLFLLVVLTLGSPAMAIVDRPDVMPEDFASPEQKLRFKALIEDLRCTVCQNQNLADSDASLARDLRHEVLDLMKQGKNDEEVVNFLVARYGNFVLYKPPFNGKTVVLWTGPFVFFALALITLIVLVRRRSQQATGALSNDEAAALQQALTTLKDSAPKDNLKGSDN